MIQKNLNFDPLRDKEAVDPMGVIDLKESFSSGVVPTQLPDSEVNYNGIEKPESILGKPEDIFEAMQMEHSINSYQPEEKKDD